MPIEFRFFLETVNAPEYDCSAHSRHEWTELHGEPQVLLGIWSVVSATVCQILYLPSLRVFYRERRLTSYKIMLSLALADMGGFACLGWLFGYSMIRGEVFCSNPLLPWILGLGELLSQISAQVIQGRPSSISILAILAYGMISILFTRPCLPNSIYQTIVLDPFIPGHSSNEYSNRVDMIHNCILVVSIPSLFMILCTVVRSKTSGLKQRISKSASSATQTIQAKIFTQAFFVNVATAILWILPAFIVPPHFFYLVGTLVNQAVHGTPAIIYLLLNRSVRTELCEMTGSR